VEKEFITTAEFGKVLGVLPSTIRRGLCIDGHYLLARPRKLRNGRLLWPVEEVRRILEGQAA